MPKIENLIIQRESRVDLTKFFGEEAYITIEKMRKYDFALLMNRNRSGFGARYYELLTERRREVGEDHQFTGDEYLEIRNSIPVDDADKLLSVDAEVDRAYYIKSIKKDGHNFTDKDGKLLELDGGQFFDLFSINVSEDGVGLNDVIISSIISLNHRGISMGEQKL